MECSFDLSASAFAVTSVVVSTSIPTPPPPMIMMMIIKVVGCGAIVVKATVGTDLFQDLTSHVVQVIHLLLLLLLLLPLLDLLAGPL